MDRPVLQIRGARTHNLHDMDLDLPLRGLTVLVGRSGSGKSSLALHTIHAASRARLALALGLPGGQDPVDVDQINGLPLTLAVEPPRSLRPSLRVIDLLGLADTVGAVGLATGAVHCPACGRRLALHTVDQIVDALAQLPLGHRLTILAPLSARTDDADQNSKVVRLVHEVGRQGFARVRLDGTIHRVDDVPIIDARIGHDLDVVVDRLRVREDQRDRLEEAVGTALTAGRGRVLALVQPDADTTTLHAWAQRPWCPHHPTRLDPPQAGWLAGRPGARCRTCQGQGSRNEESGGAPCEDCQGSGLRPEVAHFRVGPDDTPWPRLLAQPLGHALASLCASATAPALRPLQERLERHRKEADSLGLLDLPLGRQFADLASGEVARLRLLAGMLTARDLPGALLIVDEPTAGLDDPTARRLIDRLVATSATLPVLAIDHRRDLVLRADHAVCFGPGAGHHGGRVCWEGPGLELPEELLPSPVAPSLPASTPAGPALRLEGAHGRCLARAGSKGVSASFPRGRLTVVTGPSGSGKSTLLIDTLVPAVRKALGLVAPPPLPHDGVAGLEGITQVLTFDRSPLGHNRASCVVTAIGAWAALRELLAATRDARMLGFSPARFRLDRPGGRCEACQGTGLHRVVVGVQSGLSQASAVDACPACQGARFQQDTLRVRLKGRTVRGLLGCDVEQACQLFAHHRRLGPPLMSAERVGLGYLPLGQASATLSGGEAQRLRLARALASAGSIGGARARHLDDRLIVVDAPTTGLHPADIARVVAVLRQLADRGATVVVATVEPALLAAADAAIVLSRPSADPAVL
ncbi:MAG: hypothetical protein GXP62_12115 [Oligoflexia bacterium]|nr:hypothetical protein [Oligoflexia bacterium]